MNNQRKQQLFNRWYNMTCDEHIRYCSEDGCIGFIKEQPDYDESDDYDNLISQMQQVIGNNYYLFPEISVHYNERANYSAILLTILHTDGSIDEETGYQIINEVNEVDSYVIGMYYSKPNNKTTAPKFMHTLSIRTMNQRSKYSLTSTAVTLTIANRTIAS